MAREGWYYLHDNRDLIHKVDFPGIVADFRDSDLVLAFWPCDPTDRETAWNILVEALAAGARKERVLELATKWKCDDEDAAHYVERIGGGVKIFRSGAEYIAQRTLEGKECRGATALEALAELAKHLGYKPAKLWGRSFKEIVNG